INILDCPGRLELTSEVNTSLRLSDGCLLVVNLEGYNSLGYHSEMVLRQAITEKLGFILMINKLEVLLLRNEFSLEEIYQCMLRIIESVNVVICTYAEQPEQIYPQNGHVAFGSALGGWAFNLHDFAKFYSKKFGMDVNVVAEKLWGDNYFDAESGKWLKDSKQDSLERGFCQFVLKPIQKVLQTLYENASPTLEELLNPFGISISSEENELELTESVMKRWLPASKTILNMIYQQLPSPEKAQPRRVENIYTGTLTDTFGTAIKDCDPDGPLMMHITKSEIIDGIVYSVGRIFSGKLNIETPIRILGPKNVFEEKTVTGIVKINGSIVEPIEEATCGSIVGLIGIEKFLTCSGATISESSNLEAESFAELKLPHSMISYSVEPEKQANLPQLIKGMELICKCDPLMKFSLDEYTGEKVLSVVSEVHLHSILSQFKQIHPSIEIQVEEPIVRLLESITVESHRETLAKSPNKHNRFFMKAEPLQEELSNEIERGLVPENNRARYLSDQFGWSLEDAGKIWTFGPDANSPNVLVNQTKGVMNLNEMKDNSISAFKFAMSEGPVCGESVRGVRINLKDVCMNSDSIHRGAGQIIPTVRRCCHACILDSEPTLLEPILLGEFKCKESDLGTLYSTLNRRRGIIFEQTEWHSDIQVKGYVPISEYFGIHDILIGNGIFSQFIFDYWQPIIGSTDRFTELVNKIRIRKGLSETAPTYSELADRL
ncbi:predicted protein, partial [Naegleria gruberi]